MTATIMQVLDTTIVNVALPSMTGSLGATTDTISWVLTSYLIGSAVFMPLNGFLTDRLGRKKYLLVSIGGFVATSVLCGVAQGLPEMVLFRLAQGIFGASLVPLSQSVMLDTFPIESRGKAMAIWGMGVMVAPILGPTLGGYLTEIASWRWTFLVNLPVGVLSFLLAMRYVPDTPTRARRMDWTGFLALAVALIAGQLVLDRGAGEDWFESRAIVAATALAALAFGVFVWKSVFDREHAMFDLRVLTDRNFAVACVITLATGLGVFGGMLLLPMYLENLLGYPTMDAGLALMPRGIAVFVAMTVIGRLSTKVSPRAMVSAGLVISCLGSWMLTRLTPQADGAFILWPMILQGFGMGLVFLPTSTFAFATIPRALSAEAAGLYSLMRTIGSAVGIAVASTWLGHGYRVGWAELRGAVTPFNPAVRQFLAPLHLGLDHAGAQLLAGVIQQQAMINAIVSTFWLITVSFVFMLPFLLLIKAPRDAPKGAAPAHVAVE
jgi:DHA2 family multidrug resistance protein